MSLRPNPISQHHPVSQLHRECIEWLDEDLFLLSPAKIASRRRSFAPGNEAAKNVWTIVTMHALVNEAFY